jgi:hypothetical protein
MHRRGPAQNGLTTTSTTAASSSSTGASLNQRYQRWLRGGFAGHKLAQQHGAGMVVAQHQHHHGQLGMHPAVARPAADAVAQPEPQAQPSAGTASKVVKRNSLRAISSRRSRSATDPAPPWPGSQRCVAGRTGRQTSWPRKQCEGFDPEHASECSGGIPAGPKKTPAQGWGGKPFCCHTLRHPLREEKREAASCPIANLTNRPVGFKGESAFYLAQA